MDKQTLHIVTPSGRIHLLPSLAASIAYHLIPDLDIYWHVSIQQRLDKYGAEQFRDIFKRIDYGWVWPLSDDTLIHRDFFYSLFNAIQNDPRKVKIFSEKRMDRIGDLKASPDNVHPCSIDGAQAVIHSSILMKYEFNCGELRHQNDGVLLEQIFKDHPEEFQFIEQTVVYFNAISWMSRELV